jgi:hypothetical protein
MHQVHTSILRKEQVFKKKLFWLNSSLAVTKKKSSVHTYIQRDFYCLLPKTKSTKKKKKVRSHHI